MRTSSTTSKSEKNQAGLPTEGIDAITLLTEDHENVKAMFEQYEGLSDRSRASKKKLATQICQELIRHTMIEEEIFYPAVRQAIKDDDMLDEAIVEHASAKDLINQILEMEPAEDLYDAKVKVLQEMIEHHVEEEEKEMFEKARDSKLDLEELGQQMFERKQEIVL
ncbi:MAG: hemerythrin domain-containing protein [Gammaproteobacteria bacterium]